MLVFELDASYKVTSPLITTASIRGKKKNQDAGLVMNADICDTNLYAHNRSVSVIFGESTPTIIGEIRGEPRIPPDDLAGFLQSGHLDNTTGEWYSFVGNGINMTYPSSGTALKAVLELSLTPLSLGLMTLFGCNITSQPFVRNVAKTRDRDQGINPDSTAPADVMYAFQLIHQHLAFDAEYCDHNDKFC